MTDPAAPDTSLLDPSNLLGWCLAAFDREKRDASQRAAMLTELGLKRYAYDWRAPDVPYFEDELRVMRDAGIAIAGWWMPQRFDDHARRIVDLIDRYDAGTDLWIMGTGEPTHNPEQQAQRLDEYTRILRPTVEAAASLGVNVALYNHGHWFGQPANQLQLIERLADAGYDNVRIVFNLHHGRAELDRLAEQIEAMKPYLSAFNLNGVAERVPASHGDGPYILPVGQGERDLELIRVLTSSGWRGSVGVLCHVHEVDAQQRLADNLEGVAWIKALLEGADAGPRPNWWSWPVETT